MENNSKQNKANFTEKISGEDYKPYIPASKNIREFTLRGVLFGCVITIFFGAANAYLAMLIGMTVCASIPAAVMGMAFLKGAKNGTVLENNIIQTVGSAGEILAAGVAFTLPALLLINLPVKAVTVFVISATGGILGVLLMIPLRKYLIKDEHGKLPYPEGTACAEVIVAGHEGGTTAKILFSSLGLGAFFKFLTDGIQLFPYTLDIYFKGHLKGGGVGMDFLPSLLGAGFLVGPKIAGASLAGSIVGWFAVMPLIYTFGEIAPDVIAPSGDLIADMDMWGIWSSYLRYVGIGAVTMGGILSLITAIPIIIKSFKGTFGSIRSSKGDVIRTERNLPNKVIIIGTFLVLAVIAFLPVFPNAAAGSIGAILVLIFGFLFVTVSSYIVGLVGSSSNPIVAMTIGGLIVTAVVFRAMGFNGTSGVVATLVVGSIVCIAIGVSGDMSQDLKTGFLLGSTPGKQQLAQIIGILVSATVMGGVIIMLNDVYTIGSERLPAPHANIMKAVSEGIMYGGLPWTLIFAGAGIAFAVYLLGGHVLPFAVGLYLPIHLSVAMMIGGLIRAVVEKKKYEEGTVSKKIEKGTVFSSGLIAGDAIMGIITAMVIYLWDGYDKIFPIGTANGWVGLVAYGVLIAIFCWMIFGKSYEDKLEGTDLKL